MQNKLDYIQLLKKLSLVYKTLEFVNSNSIQISTRIFFETAESYLRLNLFFEEDGVWLSDSNSVYDMCYTYYKNEDKLEELAGKVGLTYNNKILSKAVTFDSLEKDLKIFEELKNILENV